MNADDILDAEEVYDDAPESGHAYADLAAAMGDEEDSDQEEEEEEQEVEEGAELGSDADDDDLDLVSDEEDELGLSDMDDPDHSDQQADNLDDDELDPFELAEATDSDDEPKQKGASGFRAAAMQSSIPSGHHMPWTSTIILPAASSAVALYSQALCADHAGFDMHSSA